ncbi:MAG: 6-phosphogluconolactonase [Elusimicrobia bacterium RIFOXYA12_FULL_51_18]|nr:MAG: 6-phosphogluconolactonase [Elusimicrobia bacterium RIFOXYA12_FULL_51_18]OGS29058.1 MAG: 6-phosphogluconolactonase [Elusimicrobia bacterium RIFOXYA2_FULL_53_38]
MMRIIRRFRDERAMAEKAIKIFRTEYGKAVRKKGFFSVVLSGGKSPRRFLKILSAQKGLNWNKIYFFFTDERLEGRNLKHSNFRAADTLLFSKTDTPRSNIFPIPVSSDSSKAAEAYESAIRSFFGGGAVGFDVVFLGLGSDGHAASLFPGGSALREKKKLAAAVTAPAYVKPRKRVTLTLKALNSAKTAVFLVSGKEKKEIFTAFASGKKNLPALKIKPAGKLYLLHAVNAADY